MSWLPAYHLSLQTPFSVSALTQKYPLSRIVCFTNHSDFCSVKKLTDREIEIIQLIMEENTNKLIAKKLNISERTVETHRKNIFRKTNSKSIVGLVKYAIKNKI